MAKKKKAASEPAAAATKAIDAYEPDEVIVHPRQRAFLVAYARVGHYSRASKLSGVGRTTVFDWRRSNPEFAAAILDAREWFTEELEFEADRRGRDGVRRLRFFQGEPIIDPETGDPYTEHEYSDSLLMFRLKALRPDVYRERHEVKINEQELNAEIETLLARRGSYIQHTNGNGHANGG